MHFSSKMEVSAPFPLASDLLIYFDCKLQLFFLFYLQNFMLITVAIVKD